jgi:hypothetical protein
MDLAGNTNRHPPQKTPPTATDVGFGWKVTRARGKQRAARFVSMVDGCERAYSACKIRVPR